MNYHKCKFCVQMFLIQYGHLISVVSFIYLIEGNQLYFVFCQYLPPSNLKYCYNKDELLCVQTLNQHINYVLRVWTMIS